MNTFEEFKKILVRPNTVVDNSAINGLYDICHKVIKDNIDGDFVEAGVWRGGLSAIFLRKIIRNKTIGSIEMLLVEIAHPITGGNDPAAPPMTIFCGVLLLSQIV